MEMPLAGIRVLDLSTMYPGPVCTMTLADFGAEVIRVEPTKGGDLWRCSLPLVNGLGMPYLQVNRNKKSICLNLKDPEAKEIFYRLVKDADVVVEQYRPGVAQRLGVDYDTLKKLNEKIVYCSISGFGQTGPYRLLAGHDINYISYAGILGLTARKGECPVLPGVQIGDVSGGALYAVIGILMALMGVKQTGKGNVYYGTDLFTNMVLQYVNTGKMPEFDIQIINNDPATTVGSQTMVYYGCHLTGSVPLSVLDSEESMLNYDFNFSWTRVARLQAFNDPVQLGD